MKTLSPFTILLYTFHLVVIVPVIILFFDAYEFRSLGFTLGGFALTASSVIVLIKGSWRWPSMWSIRSWVQWKVKVVALVTALFGVGLMGVGGYGIYQILGAGLNSSVVYFHLTNSSWTRLRFTNEDHLEDISDDFQIFTANDIDTPKAPLDYGYHIFAIDFKNGQTVWGEFWQNDPAVNRRHDIYVKYDAEQNSVQFKEVLNLTFTLFEGKVSVPKTSQKKPFRLGSCCL